MQKHFNTKWNLKLLYSGDNDPKIKADVRKYEKACANFEKKYKGRVSHLKDPKSLKKTLLEYEKTATMPEAWKAIFYFRLRSDLNSADMYATANLTKYQEVLTKASNKLLFFKIDLGNIEKKRQKKFLTGKNLVEFKYFLEHVFKTAQYDLSEKEEKILSLENLPARDMWVNSQLKLLNSQSISFKGKTLSLGQASNMVPSQTKNDRKALHKILTTAQKNIAHFAEAEINAIYMDKKICDELKGFKEPYSATVLRYQNNEKAVQSLIDTVTSHFSISHRFYKIKAKLLKSAKLSYADRAAEIGHTSKKFSWSDGVGILSCAFHKLNPHYSSIFDDFLKRGQIDAIPDKGKTSGAYCWDGHGMPTYVLLNYVGTPDSVMTFGHEMGHAFHGELSKTRRPIYDGHSTATAEVASTLFENFVFEEIFETLSDKEKVVALHDRIQDDIATIFRQIACFNFELELHHAIREKGFVPKEEIAKMHNKHMSAYLGPLFKMDDLDGYMFVSWSHIRNHFYVYSYAYGQLVSKALYKRYKKDKNFLKKIEQFLCAGESKTPEEIFQDIGIGVRKPSFWLDGIKSIEENIALLEKLTKNKKLV